MDKDLRGRPLFSKIKSCYPALRTAEKKVADYILQHGEEVTEMTVTEVAESSQVSDATVVRFCQKIGYKGFYQMKIALAQDLTHPMFGFHPSISPDHFEESIQNIFTLTLTNLKETASSINAPDVKQCVRLLNTCQSIYLFAAGNSCSIASDAMYKFSRIGLKAIHSNIPETQVALAQLMTEQDVALAISHSGSSKLILTCLEIAKKQQAKIICITNFVKSPVGKISDYHITTAAHEYIFYDDSVITRICEMAVVDMLFFLLADLRLNDSLDRFHRTENALSDYKL
ncbi:RpiR family Helix-turn-helix domain-containing protein [Candidatus Vecturithrix granuli]|uniref:RpiR family Helix-turn-helix domain-containing protein n=1 Tax=Vecturithrix granuli TaxID=1499967 RepID=A0A081BTZ5_VECG1|nr:RpiR family Helix-turn-helix domain-containing protein [Candidatus Vecturithrix granuli]